VIKRRRYRRAADAYWIVDPDARLIERWLPDDERPQILTESISWQPARRDASLMIVLSALFREASGEAPQASPAAIPVTNSPLLWRRIVRTGSP